MIESGKAGRIDNHIKCGREKEQKRPSREEINMFSTPWKQKTALRQKVAAIGFLIGIFLGATVTAYAVSSYVNSFAIHIG